MKKITLISVVSASSLLFVSCGNDPADAPRLATGTVGVNTQTSAALYAKASAYQKAGKTNAAIKTFRKIADDYPLAPQAPQARYQEASLQYAKGDLIKAFDIYQNFIGKYQSSNLYSKAVDRQFEVALAASGGNLKHNFVGIKSRYAPQTAEKMLIKCRDNAPYSKLAPRAQFEIGKLYASHKLYSKAISGYRGVQTRYPESGLAPEALYQVGTLLMKEAEKGNRNKAALDQAKNAFLDLRQLYPSHKRARDAKSRLAELRVSNIKRNYEVAEFYRAKGQLKAATLYYRDVLRISKSGKYHSLAKKRLAEITK